MTVAEHRMAGLEGGFDAERAHEVDELADLAAYAGVALTREGDWLVVSTDLRGDPKWSEQAEEFYRSLGGFVQQGEVHLRAQDGSTWSYAYSSTGVERSRTQAAGEQPEAQSTQSTEPDAGPASPEPPPAPEPTPPPTPTAEPESFIDYPGREQSPPPPSERPTEPPTEQTWDTGTPPPPPADQPPSGPPQSYRDLQLPHDDDARPSPPGRALLMTVVLVVGVLLIIGLALLASGF